MNFDAFYAHIAFSASVTQNRDRITVKSQHKSLVVTQFDLLKSVPKLHRKLPV